MFQRLGGRPGAGCRRARLCLGVLVAVMTTVPELGCAGSQKRDEPIVRELKFEGNHAISSGQIEDKILTSKTGWWPFAGKKYFDPIAWASDMQRILRIYMSRGFYQVEAHDQISPQPKNGVALTVKIDEGQPTYVGTVRVAGTDALPADTKAFVIAKLPLVVGQAFSESAWTAAKAEIVKRLRSRGYAQATAAGQALVDVHTHEAALTIEVAPGLPYRFGQIHVATEPGGRVPTYLVWEQVHLAIPEGKPFSDDLLDEAQRRVVAMGVFSSAKVTAGIADPTTQTIPVDVQVRESPFHTLRLGGGAHVDQVREEARLIGEWTNRDFLGGLRKLTIHVEAGWAFIPSLLAVATNDVSEAPRSGPIADVTTSLEQPRFLGRPSLHLKSGIEVTRNLEQAYDDISGRVVNGVIWQLRSRLTIFPSYHIEGDYLNGAPINSAASAPLTLGCHTTSGDCLVWLSYLEQQITWDLRDNALEPRAGGYFSVSFQEGGGPLGGDFSYLRVLPDVRGYVSFGEHKELTFSGRLRFGELWPTSGNPNDSAVVTRFYAGGAVSMRGFGDRRLSPLLEAPAPGTNQTVTVPIGGNGMIDGSFEARYSLTENLRLATFVDYGQVTTGLASPSDVAQLLWAAGVGLRYLTPIGPIRVDIARRLPFGRLPPLYYENSSGVIEQASYVVDPGCFGLFSTHPNSAVPDGSCVLQISIGEAF
jgi:outer membrane translocation and assembly module TamA